METNRADEKIREDCVWIENMKMRLRMLYVVLFVIMLFLVIASALTSYVLPPDYVEIFYVERDSILLHVFVLVIVLMYFTQLRSGLFHNCDWNKLCRILLPICLLFVGIFSLYWAVRCEYVPLYDQGYVCRAAKTVASGEKIGMGEIAYINQYPQQAGIVWLFSIFISLFGAGGPSYMTLHLFLAFCVPLIVWNGYILTDTLFEDRELDVYYLLAGMGFLPLIFYVNFLYSDIPGILLLLVALNATLRHEKTGLWYDYLLGVSGFILAIIVRKNNVIICIAVVVIWSLYALLKRDVTVLAKAGLAFVMVFLGAKLMSYWLERKYGIDSQLAEPSIAWIAMGMQRSGQGAGWYNGYLSGIYAATQGNREAIVNDSILQIKRSLLGFLHNPGDAVKFYIEKFLLQWNQPSYQCLGVAETYDRMPDGLVKAIYQGRLFASTRAYFDCYQYLVYVGFTIHLWNESRRKEHCTYKMIPILAIFGGMLFSILWETKSRYILPYFVIMIPYAVKGWSEIRKKEKC